MDESEAAQRESAGAPTPIFNVYRRGYDPEQVDRYVAEQQRRLDEALHRASEAERKLAAAVGQLRELHRRVAVYESEARTAQAPALDTLGERVQRILQEAWEGAYNLRQEAEKEVSDLREGAQREVDHLKQEAAEEADRAREVASEQAAELIDEATRRALALRDEMDRRREAYLERVEQDRQRAVSQISYLYDQRQLAIAELARLQATVEATIEEMVHNPLARSAGEIAQEARERAGEATPAEDATALEDPVAGPGETGPSLQPAGEHGEPDAAGEPSGTADAPTLLEETAAESAGAPGSLESSSADLSETVPGSQGWGPGATDLTVPADEAGPSDRELSVGADGSVHGDAAGVGSPDPGDKGGPHDPAQPSGNVEPETLFLHVEEVPTGPMDPVEYGYQASDVTDIMEAPRSEGVERVAEGTEGRGERERSRPRGPKGQQAPYDVEEDGWS